MKVSAPGDILILCDFDGTVCTVDMGNEVLNRFTDKGWEDVHDDIAGYISERLSATAMPEGVGRR
ncbi:MAG: hypothetical protein WCH07_08440 [Deltaproteobacteria bacterium]